MWCFIQVLAIIYVFWLVVSKLTTDVLTKGKKRSKHLLHNKFLFKTSVDVLTESKKRSKHLLHNKFLFKTSVDVLTEGKERSKHLLIRWTISEHNLYSNIVLIILIICILIRNIYLFEFQVYIVSFTCSYQSCAPHFVQVSEFSTSLRDF